MLNLNPYTAVNISDDSFRQNAVISPCFNRMCSLHTQNPSFHCIKVVYFNALGAELQEIQKGNDDTKKILVKRLKEKHSLSETFRIVLAVVFI